MVIEYKLIVTMGSRTGYCVYTHCYLSEQVWLLYINSLLTCGAGLVIEYKLLVTKGSMTGYCI